MQEEVEDGESGEQHVVTATCQLRARLRVSQCANIFDAAAAACGG